MEKSLKSIATDYGLYLGVALTLWTVAVYAIDLELIVNFWINLLFLPLVIISVGIISVAKSKSLYDGYISFKSAFTSYFITVALGITISFIVSIILFNFIDTDAALKIKEIAIEKTISMLEGFNVPPEQISEQVEAMEGQNIFSFKSQLFQIAQSLVLFSIIGLIVAAAMKKTNPDSQ